MPLSNFGGQRSWGELLEMGRERAQLADMLGYSGIWLGEHHFEMDGSDVCPNPVMLGADLAARTERVRICMGAVSLTLWHPLRVAEDLAMLDHFCGGRLDVALSRGIINFEIVNMNPDADRRNPAQSKAVFSENLAILRRAWTQKCFNWHGDRYTFPQAGFQHHPRPGAPPPEGYVNERGEIVSLSVVPRPVQSPMPGLWATTEGIDGFAGAAEAALGAITWYPTGERLRQTFDAYRQAAARRTGVAPALGENCALLRMALIAPSDAEAREIAELPLTNWYHYINTVRGSAVWLDVGEDPQDERIVRLKPFDLMMERDHLLVGAPESVAERMRRLGRTHGVEHWLVNHGVPGIPRDATDRSIELFAREVIPALGSEFTAAAGQGGPVESNPG